MVLNSQNNQTMLKKALKLEKAMIREGLDVDPQFVYLLDVITVTHDKLGKAQKGADYRLLMVELRACLEDDE